MKGTGEIRCGFCHVRFGEKEVRFLVENKELHEVCYLQLRRHREEAEERIQQANQKALDLRFERE